MGDKDLWTTFKKTGSIKDYLSYKGICTDDMRPEKKNVGEESFEPENNSDRTDFVRDTYR